MIPTKSQGEAIKAVIRWYRDAKAGQVFYLAGYAGVGKSEVAKLAIEELRLLCRIKTVLSGAFTGKAASVLRRKGVEDAQTIHSMIYTPVQGANGTVRFVLDRAGAAADADLIVLDECSMVDQDMARDILSFGKKVLVLGDPGQLPPVRGLGAFTSRTPDFFLTEIHRQAADSPIVMLATRAREGKAIPTGDYGDGVRVLPLTVETQAEVYRQDTQALCGLHRVRRVYTQRIRKTLGYGGRVPMKGERVLCCKNNRERGIFNGGQGIVLADPKLLGDCLEVDARMDDLDAPLLGATVHPYLFAQHFDPEVARPDKLPRGIDEFDWGYLLTCHKAQGSEWPHVTIVDDSAAFRDERSKWLYTAITRASQGLTLLQRGA